MIPSVHPANVPDLRNTGIHRDHWYPLARSHKLKAGGTLAASFAGEPVVLARTESGALFALEDRCAHRQVPLSAGVVAGEQIRCGYHGWVYDGSGKCISVPYLGKRDSLPNGVRSYPCREAYDFIFVFPGDPAKAAEEERFPMVPSQGDPSYKTRYLDREVRCHYSYMHENLMDMNHQFLHRRLMGGIQAGLVETRRGEGWFEAVYTFDRVSGRQSLGEKFMVGHSAGKRRERDLMTIRTQYPYQTLQFTRGEQEKPALDLWLAYVPVDRQQKRNHSMGLMMIRRPSIPGLIHLFWPFIVLFTEGIFAQDRRIVELEQEAYDRQEGDWNQEIFPVIRSLRELLVQQGVPL